MTIDGDLVFVKGGLVLCPPILHIFLCLMVVDNKNDGNLLLTEPFVEESVIILDSGDFVIRLIGTPYKRALRPVTTEQYLYVFVILCLVTLFVSPIVCSYVLMILYIIDNCLLNLLFALTQSRLSSCYDLTYLFVHTRSLHYIWFATIMSSDLRRLRSLAATEISI